MENQILSGDLQYIWDRFSERNKLQGSTILVTGCAGFLGFTFMHFFVKYAERLSLRSVIGLDNYKLGKPQWLLELEKNYPSILKLRTFDISTDDLSTVPGASEADFVIHMASIASPTFYRANPIETVEANIWGLKALLDYYKSRGLKGLLFFSSSEIYGDPPPDQIPTSEEYRGNVSAVGPRACYDESKRFGETLCYLYSLKHGLPIGVVRPFNNYGPGMKLNDQRVPADFAKAILERRDIEIFSDGTPTRTFCYVTDAVAGYLKALTYGKFDYFNIGIEQPEISIRQLAEIYRQIGEKRFGYHGRVVLTPPKEAAYLTHNPNRRCPQIRKAREVLHYEPRILVEEGVERFLDFLTIEQKALHVKSV